MSCFFLQTVGVRRSLGTILGQGNMFYGVCGVGVCGANIQELHKILRNLSMYSLWGCESVSPMTESIHSMLE